MNRVKSILLVAGISLALAFTISCGDHSGGDDPSSSSGTGMDNSSPSNGSSSSTQGSGNSSSSGGTSSSSSEKSSSSGNAFVGEKGKFTDARDNEKYDWVKIGEQIWMAENLNYVASSSVCYAEDVSGVSADSIAKNCETYGRLYNWAAAMGLPSKCNNTLSTSDDDCKINMPHNGICPEGFHIPTNEEWNTLFEFVDNANNGDGESSSCGSGTCYESKTAGKYLKATSGWNDYDDVSGNGLDTYGFAALPGGYGRSDGSFIYLGHYGNWCQRVRCLRCLRTIHILQWRECWMARLRR